MAVATFRSKTVILKISYEFRCRGYDLFVVVRFKGCRSEFRLDDVAAALDEPVLYSHYQASTPERLHEAFDAMCAAIMQAERVLRGDKTLARAAEQHAARRDAEYNARS